MGNARIAVTCLGILLLGAAHLHGQDTLSAARDLYASAEYDSALKLLDRLSGASSEDQQSIELYRSLCLLAVGRTQDAERSVEMIIARDPLYRPGEDLSPRMRTAFSEARKRLLPSIVQQQYADAKGAFERKEFESAASGFRRVVDALNDPDMGSAASKPPLADLRTLAAGFHDLSVKGDTAGAGTRAAAPAGCSGATSGRGRRPSGVRDLHGRGTKRRTAADSCADVAEVPRSRSSSRGHGRRRSSDQ